MEISYLHPLIEVSEKIGKVRIPLHTSLRCDLLITEEGHTGEGRVVVYQAESIDCFLYQPENGAINTAFRAQAKARSSICAKRKAPSFIFRVPRFVSKLIELFFAYIFLALIGTGAGACRNIHEGMDKQKKAKLKRRITVETLGLQQDGVVRIPWSKEDEMVEDIGYGCMHMYAPDAPVVKVGGQEYVEIDRGHLYALHINIAGSVDSSLFFISSGCCISRMNQNAFTLSGQVRMSWSICERFQIFGQISLVSNELLHQTQHVFGTGRAAMWFTSVITNNFSKDVGTWLPFQALQIILFIADRFRWKNPFFDEYMLANNESDGGLFVEANRRRFEACSGEVSDEKDRDAIDDAFYPGAMHSYIGTPTMTWPKLFAAADGHFSDFVGPRSTLSKRQFILKARRWHPEQERHPKCRYRDLYPNLEHVARQRTLHVDIPAYWPHLPRVKAKKGSGPTLDIHVDVATLSILSLVYVYIPLVVFAGTTVCLTKHCMTEGELGVGPSSSRIVRLFNTWGGVEVRKVDDTVLVVKLSALMGRIAIYGVQSAKAKHG